MKKLGIDVIKSRNTYYIDFKDTNTEETILSLDVHTMEKKYYIGLPESITPETQDIPQEIKEVYEYIKEKILTKISDGHVNSIDEIKNQKERTGRTIVGVKEELDTILADINANVMSEDEYDKKHKNEFVVSVNEDMDSYYVTITDRLTNQELVWVDVHTGTNSYAINFSEYGPASQKVQKAYEFAKREILSNIIDKSEMGFNQSIDKIAGRTCLNVDEHMHNVIAKLQVEESERPQVSGEVTAKLFMYENQEQSNQYAVRK